MPFVSVCEISIGQLKAATFALVAFLVDESGSRPKTMPLTTLDWERLLPIIFTTRMLSILKLAGFLGRTASIASDTSEAIKSSLPDCLEAMTVRRALASSGAERMSLTRSTTSSEVQSAYR